MTSRIVRVEPREVVYLKSIFEANLGVAAIFADQGGMLTVAAPRSQSAALDELLADLLQELGSGMSLVPVSTRELVPGKEVQR